MVKAIVTAFISIIIFSFLTSNVFAQGLLGEKFILFEAGVLKPGNDYIKAWDDSITFFNFCLSLPLNNNIDFGLSFEQQKVDGKLWGQDTEGTINYFNCNFQYHFMPANQTDPYISMGLGHVDIEGKMEGYETQTDDTTGFTLGGGIEIKLSEHACLTPTILHSNYDAFEDTAIGVGINYWLNDNFGLIGNFTHLFEESDTMFGGGLIIGI